MFEDYIRERITELRMRKNVSERCMSLDMGRSQAVSYTHLRAHET